MIKTWINGDKGETVKKVIDDNFKTVSKHLSGNVLSLSSIERLSLGDDYLRDGLIVYDIDGSSWYQYKDKKWELYTFTGEASRYTKNFSVSDWEYSSAYKCYKIDIPPSEHGLSAHSAQAYILADSFYEPVCGGVYISSEGTVSARSNLAFSGKVEIW